MALLEISSVLDGTIQPFLTKGRGPYTYIGVRSLSLKRSRYKNHLPPTPCDLHMFRFMIVFASCFVMGKVYEGHSQHVVPNLVMQCPTALL
jgi:hypothetical protein